MTRSTDMTAFRRHLLAHLRAAGGPVTTQMVVRFYESTGRPRPRRSTAQADLRALAAAGYLRVYDLPSAPGQPAGRRYVLRGGAR